jgi:glycosyltransferase involved in cell wall biosynthesis
MSKTRQIIGIDGRTLYFPDSVARGVGQYSFNHIQAIIRMKPEWDFILFGMTPTPPPCFEQFKFNNLSFKHYSEYDPKDVNLVHICDPMTIMDGYVSPVKCFPNVRQTMTFYDLIPLSFYFDLWPEFRRKSYAERLSEVASGNRVFLSISEFTRQDLLQHLRIEPNKVVSIMAGVNHIKAVHNKYMPDAEEQKKRLGITGPFFLHVGALDPHKNFEAVVKSFAALQSHEDILLVVVGELSGSLLEYERWFRASCVHNVLFTGFLDRNILEILYQDALALLFLSRYEGFGLPVLEAMANGCPVITTNVSSIPEVAGDAALMFDPDDISGIAGAMNQLLSDSSQRTALIKAGYDQATNFSWEKTAEKTIAVWQNMLDEDVRLTATKPVERLRGRISVMLDISVLGLAQHDPTSRTGVFRVVEHLAKELAGVPEVELHFCSTQHLSGSGVDMLEGCRDYLNTHPEFSSVPFHERDYPPADIFHSPFHPLPQHTPATVRFQTVYDLIPVLFPSFFQGRYNPVSNILAGILQGDHALCISHATKDDLCRVTGMNGAHAHVTHLAADPAIFYPCTDLQQQLTVRQKYNLGDAPYILSLCTLEPRKNIDHLLRAFARLVRNGAIGNIRLVLTGAKGWDFDRIFSEIDNNPELHTRIILTGYVPDGELAPLYSGAQVFAYMSLYEGFGLPPLEAMQCGTPVITSNTSSLPEVVGDAGIMLDPQDMDGLCQALVRMTTDHAFRDDLAQRALKRAALFSWERCVSDTIAAYKQALGVEPAAAVVVPTTADAAKRPVRLYCYRPGTDFSLDERACYILAPLMLGTSLEQVCEVTIPTEQWRFHPISHEWHTNPLWADYRYDADLFVISESPEEADFFVFPYLLDELIECAGVQSVVAWLKQLPYYEGAEERHLFMTLHDSSEPFGMPSCFFRASIKHSSKDSAAFALPYPVDDFCNRCHFESDRIKYDVSFVGFIGDAVSGPVRRAMVESLQRTSQLRAYISVSERFHGFEEPEVRLRRRELFVESLASSWLVICPRGTGENSYRFFETLSMGRIPVLLSDDCLLPFEESIDYDSIILRIPEHAADRSAEILQQWLASQTIGSVIDRCKKARKVWEQYLACPQWNRRIIETLRARQTLDRIVIDGVIFQLQHGRPFGISRLWLSMLTELGRLPIGRRIILLDRAGTAPELPGIRKLHIGAYTLGTAQDEAAVLDRLCTEQQASLFLSTYYTFTTVTASLLMLYDMIPERFDAVGPAVPNPEWRDKYHAVMRAAAFASISASTARDLATYYPEVAQRKMAVVPCAVSEVFRPHSADEIAAFRAASGITKPYFLLVGRRDQHKNVALFFRAFAKLANCADYALVMAGTTQPLEPDLRAMAGDAEGYAGFFTDEALSLVYSGAVALVYPSRHEGFGLPILEAMQSGCPVITCQNSSLPEVAGSAALYVGEDSVDEMQQALQAVQQPEVREYLVKRGLERAGRFSWQESAKRLVQLIDEVERSHD